MGDGFSLALLGLVGSPEQLSVLVLDLEMGLQARNRTEVDLDFALAGLVDHELEPVDVARRLEDTLDAVSDADFLGLRAAVVGFGLGFDLGQRKRRETT